MNTWQSYFAWAFSRRFPLVLSAKLIKFMKKSLTPTIWLLVSFNKVNVVKENTDKKKLKFRSGPT